MLPVSQISAQSAAERDLPPEGQNLLTNERRAHSSQRWAPSFPAQTLIHAQPIRYFGPWSANATGSLRVSWDVTLSTRATLYGDAPHSSKRVSDIIARTRGSMCRCQVMRSSAEGSGRVQHTHSDIACPPQYQKQFPRHHWPKGSILGIRNETPVAAMPSSLTETQAISMLSGAKPTRLHGVRAGTVTVVYQRKTRGSSARIILFRGSPVEGGPWTGNWKKQVLPNRKSSTALSADHARLNSRGSRPHN